MAAVGHTPQERPGVEPEDGQQKDRGKYGERQACSMPGAGMATIPAIFAHSDSTRLTTRSASTDMSVCTRPELGARQRGSNEVFVVAGQGAGIRRRERLHAAEMAQGSWSCRDDACRICKAHAATDDSHSSGRVGRQQQPDSAQN